VDEVCAAGGYRIIPASSREKLVFGEICTTNKLWDLKRELYKKFKKRIWIVQLTVFITQKTIKPCVAKKKFENTLKALVSVVKFIRFRGIFCRDFYFLLNIDDGYENVTEC
jgi:hypothetical protein